MYWNILYSLDLVAIALFLISYYRKCYRRGYRIDFWRAQTFLFFIFPNMIMLTFAKGELNIVVLGNDLNAVIAALPVVFLITLLGYSAVLMGSSLWRIQLGIGVRRNAVRVLRIV